MTGLQCGCSAAVVDPGAAGQGGWAHNHQPLSGRRPALSHPAAAAKKHKDEEEDEEEFEGDDGLSPQQVRSCASLGSAGPAPARSGRAPGFRPALCSGCARRRGARMLRCLVSKAGGGQGQAFRAGRSMLCPRVPLQLPARWGGCAVGSKAGTRHSGPSLWIEQRLLGLLVLWPYTSEEGSQGSDVLMGAGGVPAHHPVRGDRDCRGLAQGAALARRWFEQFTLRCGSLCCGTVGRRRGGGKEARKGQGVQPRVHTAGGLTAGAPLTRAVCDLAACSKHALATPPRPSLPGPAADGRVPHARAAQREERRGGGARGGGACGGGTRARGRARGGGARGRARPAHCLLVLR